MLKFIFALIICALFTSAYGSENVNASSRSKRGLFWSNYNLYPYYNYYYYNWYTWFPTKFLLTSTCSVASVCPSQCPGKCGLFSGLNACLCNQCQKIGDPCNLINISKGLYLHPFSFDAGKYVQCDSMPGVFYIRSCPAGLVFDPQFGVCNYPVTAYVFWNNK